VHGVVPAGQGERPAVDDQATVGVKGIISRIDGQAPTVNGHADHCLDTLGRCRFANPVVAAPARGQRDLPAGDRDARLGLDGVTTRDYIDHAVLNGDIPLGGILGAVRLQAVALRADGDVPTPDDDVVLAPDAIVHSGDGDRPAGDHQTVFAGDAVIVVAGDRQCAVSGDGQVALAEERRVRFILVRARKHIGGPIRNGVLGARVQDDDHLCRVHDVER